MTKLSMRTETVLAEEMREDEFKSADQAVYEGLALLKARREFRRAVFEADAAGARGELFDAETAFKEVLSELRAEKRRAGK
jgi:hypothetical protein